MQLFLLVLTAGVTCDLKLGGWKTPDPAALLQPVGSLQVDEQSAARLMAWSNSGLAAAAREESWQDYWSRRMPEDMMKSNLRVLASRGVSRYLPEQEAAKEDTQAVSRPADKQITDGYVERLKGHSVVFYCTHSAETYVPDSGKARLDGKHGLVGEVAGRMADDLTRYGLQTEYIDTLHDSPDYNMSYTRSRETVKSVVESRQDLLALFDIHRDSIPGQEDGETININGRPSARILIIVGTDERKPHPHWRENRAFAEELCKAGEEMYPGLLKGIKTKAGTYNQEFFPHALLLEFGSDRNTQEEADYAAELFNDILVKVLGEETE
ncbi:MAG: stage II sporulation protein P [Deltaproteobacteria bacterium]